MVYVFLVVTVRNSYYTRLCLLIIIIIIINLPKGRHTQKAKPVQGASPIINYIKYKQNKKYILQYTKKKH